MRMGCQKCEDLQVRQRIRSPSDFRQAFSVVLAAVEAGTLSELIDPNKEAWRTHFSRVMSELPSEHILCDFSCNSCRQQLSLFCKDYDDSAGGWLLVLVPNNSFKQNPFRGSA